MCWSFACASDEPISVPRFQERLLLETDAPDQLPRSLRGNCGSGERMRIRRIPWGNSSSGNEVMVDFPYLGVGQSRSLSILVGWTSSQLFWGLLGAKVLTQTHVRNYSSASSLFFQLTWRFWGISSIFQGHPHYQWDMVWEKLSVFFNLRWFGRSEILPQIPALHACWFFFTAGLRGEDICIDVPPFCGCMIANTTKFSDANDIFPTFILYISYISYIKWHSSKLVSSDSNSWSSLLHPH